MTDGTNYACREHKSPTDRSVYYCLSACLMLSASRDIACCRCRAPASTASLRRRLIGRAQLGSFCPRCPSARLSVCHGCSPLTYRRRTPTALSPTTAAHVDTATATPARGPGRDVIGHPSSPRRRQRGAAPLAFGAHLA